MFVQALELSDFRNYSSLQLELHQGINIFYGDNAQGKTNILEAIFLCSTNKSYRGSRDREMIRFGMEEAHVKLMVEKQSLPYRIDLHLKKSRTKGIAVNSIPIRKTSELLGILHVVFFSPEDLQLIKNGPAQRRRFLDLELCQLDRIYLHELNHYNKCLLQRNLLLKDLYVHPENEDTLEVWDQQLAEYGTKLVQIRAGFLQRLEPVVYEIHKRLSGGAEELRISYEPNVSAEQLAGALAANRERDKKQKVTTVGPHKDDIRFLVNGVDIRMYGSQGQQRTAALALKISEIEMIREILKESPVLLLDDVLSELDHSRQNYLLDQMGGIQTLITCTGLDDFVRHRFHIDQVFHVEHGIVCREA